MPPARVATIGRAHAIASSSDVPSPSVTELIANRSKPLMQPSTSVRKPGQQHVLLEMVLVDLLLEALAQLAFAEDDEARVGHLLHHEVRGVDQMALPFVRHERRDVADDRRAVRQPERLVHVDRAARRRRARRRCLRAPSPSDRPGTPSATSICRIASDAAMKQSTWRYFQRENELPFR